MSIYRESATTLLFSRAYPGNNANDHVAASPNRNFCSTLIPRIPSNFEDRCRVSKFDRICRIDEVTWHLDWDKVTFRLSMSLSISVKIAEFTSTRLVEKKSAHLQAALIRTTATSNIPYDNIWVTYCSCVSARDSFAQSVAFTSRVRSIVRFCPIKTERKEKKGKEKARGNANRARALRRDISAGFCRYPYRRQVQLEVSSRFSRVASSHALDSIATLFDMSTRRAYSSLLN